jgi:hypothetical protein
MRFDLNQREFFQLLTKVLSCTLIFCISSLLFKQIFNLPEVGGIAKWTEENTIKGFILLFVLSVVFWGSLIYLLTDDLNDINF